VHLWNY